MKPELIVMLTHDDLTVSDAYEVFDACRDTEALYWGFKEKPLPIEEMQRIYAHMKAHGKRTVLEVVAYTEAEGLAGAEMAAQCGCDILMGTCFHESILRFCQQHGIAYMPFVGEITGRPSILEGSIEDMVAEAERLKAQGVFGIDLLGYRYRAPFADSRGAEEDAQQLIREIVARCGLPVCVAGSIDSMERLRFIQEVQPWAFTIGSAFFDHKFGETIAEQIERVVAAVAAT